MIICQNCGTTNNEAITHTCRKCGALLPVPSKTSRSRGEKPGKKKKAEQKSKEQLSEEFARPEEVEKEIIELQEIPKVIETSNEKVELQEIPQPSIDESERSDTLEHENLSEESKPEVLQEIPAQPYRGTIMESRKGFQPPPSLPTPPSRSKDAISNAFMELKSSVLEDKEKEQTIPLSPIPIKTGKSDESTLKQKRLEKDMTEVLGFLSKKISVKKLDIPEPELVDKIEISDEIPPSSMNEILKRLLTLDLNIEASALIKNDGTILASAISGRISDSLFATIGMNLSMMGSDIIEGLDAGVLKSISVRGSTGVFDLAPIDKDDPNVKDMFLIILSHSKVKSGIISFAANIVKKQLKEYLGLEK